MRVLTVVSSLVGFGLLVVPPLAAAPIPGLFTTGVNNFGNALPLGSPDPHYTILETNTNPFVLTNPRINYVNNSTSQWIWQNSNGTPTDVSRTFRTTFILTEIEPNTASISGKWAVDNVGLDILINGVSTGNSIPFGFSAFKNFTDFSISEGFISGLNTLDFIVRDEGVISGFLVGEISGTTSTISKPESVPEPASTLGLLTLGAIGLGTALKKQSQVHLETRPARQ
jgi:hypothetical protein